MNRPNDSTSGLTPSPANAPVFFVLCGTSVLCVLLLVVRAYRMGETDHVFLLWNLFLAWLPLVVSLAAASLSKLLKGAALRLCWIVLGVAWVLLYPNAPYLTTDLIHLIANPSYNWIMARESLLVWYDLIIYVLFSWCGLLLGYLSMYHFHTIVHSYAGRAAGWLFVVVVSFLSGFGIYLGRVIRLNSWDAIFSPFRLLYGIREGLGHNGVIFTALFGLLVLIVYLSLSSLHLGLPGPRHNKR